MTFPATPSDQSQVAAKSLVVKVRKFIITVNSNDGYWVENTYNETLEQFAERVFSKPTFLTDEFSLIPTNKITQIRVGE